MDLAAVKAAPVPLLACGAVAAARNVLTLVEDAEVLHAAGRPARAYSLAVLAIEELGKAGNLVYLAAMPEKLRAQAPVGRLLEWHQMKLVKGTFLATVQVTPSCVSGMLAPGPLSDVAEILDRAQAFARDGDRVRLRGLYVDVERGGQVQQPSAVTAAQVREQLDKARRAAAVANELLDPGMPDQIAHPQEATVEFSRALISAVRVAGHGRSAKAAADVLFDAATKLVGV
jgi:AbiV family abortive infection protein